MNSCESCPTGSVPAGVIQLGASGPSIFTVNVLS